MPLTSIASPGRWSPPPRRNVSPPPGPRLARPCGGARAEILAVINDLVARSGRPEVTLVQLVAEMRGRGSEYAEPTVRTMVSSHMCAQVHGPNIGSYDDLDRVGARPALPSTNLLSSRQATRQRSRLLPTYPSIVEKQSKPGLDDSLPLL
jgi:hypothetical protein